MRAGVFVALLAAIGTACSVPADSADSTADPTPATSVTAPAPTTSPPTAPSRAPSTQPTDDDERAGVERCWSFERELERREAAGTLDLDDWEVELDEEETDLFIFPLEPFDGSVAAIGERPTFERFTEPLALAEVSDIHLATALEMCFETGLLVEDLDDES